MLNKIFKSILFKNTFIYTSLQLLNKGVPFLLIPILTKYLTTEDYGTISIYNTYIQFISIFIGMGLDSTVTVNYYSLNSEEFKKYIANVIYVLICTTTIVFFVIYTFQDIIISITNLPIIWLYIGILVASLSIITGINLVLWRIKHKAKEFAIYELSQTFINITISLFLIIVLYWGWIGRVIGSGLAITVFGILSIFFIKKRGYIHFIYIKKYFKEALKLGISILPHHLALWAKTGIDILLITYLVGKNSAGIYALGYQFGAIIGILAGAFNNAFVPYLYEKLKEDKMSENIKLVKMSYIYFIGILSFSIIFSIIINMIFPYFVNSKFEESLKFVIWISISYAFQGMYFMVVNYLYYTKNNHILSKITLSIAIIQVLLSWLLINKYGAIGAAYTTLFSFSSTFFLVWFISNKVYPMPWKLWNRRNLYE